MRSIRVVVRDLAGAEYAYMVEAEDSIGSIKERLSGDVMMSVSDIPAIVYDGLAMSDDVSLASLRIDGGVATLFMTGSVVAG